MCTRASLKSSGHTNVAIIMPIETGVVGSVYYIEARQLLLLITAAMVVLVGWLQQRGEADGQHVLAIFADGSCGSAAMGLCSGGSSDTT
ncbi:unnamed protein product [Urochloa humidicola]